MKNNLFRKQNILCYLIFASIILGCTGGKTKTEEKKPAEITVFAAASLTNVLNELIDSFNVNQPVKVITNMASSGTLARQIQQGGTADIYISANEQWANYIDSLGLMISEGKKIVAKNTLVFITPIDSKQETFAVDSNLNLAPVLNGNRLSIGDPAHVPAGIYAKQALDFYGWFDDISTQILPAKDVRSALMVVELGEAPLGIVYRTDAEESAKVKIVGSFPEKSHQPIVYMSCLLSEREEVKSFFEFIESEESSPIWKKYGFTR